MEKNNKRWEAALNKELLTVEKQEKKMAQAALNVKPAAWKQDLQSRIPAKVYSGLESAFCKAFALVFNQGRTIIEKGYKKEAIQADYAIRDFAVQVKGSRKELKQMNKSVRQTGLLNLAMTTAEGVALGAVGIGIPDIALFMGTLLKGIYETALSYGYDYENRHEQILILKMMQTALSTGEDWSERNAEIDEMLMMETVGVTQEYFADQMRETAAIFAMDMLLLKFIQGLPVVGILGGAANPVYYSKIMKYVHLKYRKRYLLKQKNNQNDIQREGRGNYGI